MELLVADPNCSVGIGVVQCPSPNRTHSAQPTSSPTVITKENLHQNASLPQKEFRTAGDKGNSLEKILILDDINIIFSNTFKKY